MHLNFITPTTLSFVHSLADLIIQLNLLNPPYVYCAMCAYIIIRFDILARILKALAKFLLDLKFPFEIP